MWLSKILTFRKWTIAQVRAGSWRKMVETLFCAPQQGKFSTSSVEASSVFGATHHPRDIKYLNEFLARNVN
jgi:hypothetical protein